MEVRLHRNSWHTRLYRWTHGKEPVYWSLCPYFWSIIACIIASPFVLILNLVGIDRFKSQPAQAYHKPTRTQLKKDAKRAKLQEKRSQQFSKVVFGLFFGLVLAAFVFGIFEKGWLILIEFAIFIVFLIVVAFLIIGISWLSAKISSSDSWEAIRGMAGSLWNHICPAIDWQYKSNHKQEYSK
jgi:uncharacterized ion transporter superfamily protein YfcC